MGAHYFRNCYIGMISISFLSNAVVVASITWLSGFFIAPEQRYLSRIIDNDPVVLFSSRILPFLIVMPFIYLVISPGFAADFVRKIADSTRLQKRALQLPILVSLLATSGWVIGIFSFTAILFFRPGIPRQFIWDSLIFTWVLAAMALLICYYSLEFINRRIILPKISEQIKPEALMGAFNLSIRMRLVLHLLATVGLPLIILARIIFFLDAHKPADFEYLATRDLVLLLLLIVFIGVLLTWLQSKFISAPLREMQSATTRIQTGEFATSVSVTSGDEIGTLAADINAMARGLAEREEMRETFGRMVDPSVRDYLLGSGQLDGELRVISVLFCDLAGFTGFSEKNSPAEVVKFLNRYFELAQNVVSAHGGIINKFIGDAFMAIFNAPVPLKTHADAAIAAALQFRASYIGLSDEKPGIRLGIHSGEVLAGRIGSEQRQEYTVIGDAVNVAARIEALGKKVGENLLLSDATAALATKESMPQLRKIGKIMLRGKSSGTVVYAL